MCVHPCEDLNFVGTQAYQTTFENSEVEVLVLLESDFLNSKEKK